MARELTSGDNRDVDELRQAIEQMMLKHDKNPKVVAKHHKAHAEQGTVRIDVDEDTSEEVLEHIRKNREQYEADD
jgi:multidrug efflux pump subunit AcrB